MLDQSDPRRLAAAVIAVAREKHVTVGAASLAHYAFNTLLAPVIFAYVSLRSASVSTPSRTRSTR